MNREPEKPYICPMSTGLEARPTLDRRYRCHATRAYVIIHKNHRQRSKIVLAALLSPRVQNCRLMKAGHRQSRQK
jgi:hypothetical protein